MRNFTEARKVLEERKVRSAWSKGVKIYAIELLDGLVENYAEEDICNPTLLRKALLNGASDWAQYSEGGCSLVYDCDIAERLCTPTELKRTNGGEKMPNSRENWIDVQSRALYQAYKMVLSAFGAISLRIDY